MTERLDLIAKAGIILLQLLKPGQQLSLMLLYLMQAQCPLFTKQGEAESDYGNSDQQERP